MTESEIDAILNVARSWVGYLEKNSNDFSSYENKTANAGKSNWTRFGRIHDLITKGSDKKSKDGLYWCAMFVISCVYESKAGHVNTAQPLGSLNPRNDVIEWMKKELGPLGGLAACSTWVSNFRKMGRVDNNPAKGAFVVFLDESNHAYHIGIVESVGPNGAYTTIEGNTSAGDGVIPNGGGVERKNRNTSRHKALFLHPVPGEYSNIETPYYDYNGGDGGYGGGGGNRVTNLSKARNRQNGSDPMVSENRKMEFDSLANMLISNAPALGRDAVKSMEMYGPEIMKGDQLAKKHITGDNTEGETV